AGVRLVLDEEVRIAADPGLVCAVDCVHLHARHPIGDDAERELGAPLRMLVLEPEVTVHDHERRGRMRERRYGRASRLRTVTERDRPQLQSQCLATSESE